MPKKSLKDYTENELAYKKIVDLYNKNKAVRNRIYDDSIDISFKAKNYELGDNNLAYYKKNGPDSEKEEEDFEKLKVEEKYYQELNKKCQVYLNGFEEFYKAYTKAKNLQGQACELDLAIEKAKKINQAAKESNVDNLLNIENKKIEGLHEAIVEYRIASNKLMPLLKDFRDYSKKEVLQNQINDALKVFYKKKDAQHKEEEKQRQEEEKIRQEKMAKQKEKEEAEKLKQQWKQEEEKRAKEKADKEAEEKRKVEEAKAKEEAEKKKAIDEKKAEADKVQRLKNDADEGRFYSSDKETLENIAKKLKLDEKFNDPKTYKVHGFDKELTLKEAFEACKQGFSAFYGSITIKNNAATRNRNLEHLGAGFDDGKNKFKENFINEKEIVDNKDKSNPKKYTQNKYTSLKDRSFEIYTAKNYMNDLCKDALSDGGPTPKEFASIVSYANQFAQMHHNTKEPGFFSKLFNTKYNQIYNDQKEALESIKQNLGQFKLGDDFIKQITDKETCANPIEKKDLFNLYNDNYVTNSEDKDVEKDNEYAETKALAAVVYDVYFGKDPVSSLNEYLKKYENIVEYENEDVKENGSYLDERDKEYSEEMDKKLNNRIPFEVTECKNEEQAIEDNKSINEEELNLEKEANINIY